MAVSYIREGELVAWTNGTGSAVESGDVIVLGTRQLAIATVDIANGDVGTVATEGVYQLAKHATANAITQGAPCYWDTSGEKIYNAAANGRYFIGYADEAAGATDTTVLVKLGLFTDEPARQITLAATGNQILGAENFLNGKGLVVKVPNTAGLSVTFPAMSTVPSGVVTLIQKSSADAAAITVAANASDTLVGTIGTIDAANDRAILITTATGPTTIAASIIA